MPPWADTYCARFGVLIFAANGTRDDGSGSRCLEGHRMIETIGFILFILAIIFVAVGPKAPDKKEKENENDSDINKK